MYITGKRTVSGPLDVGPNINLPGPHTAPVCSKARIAASQLARGGTAYDGMRALQYTSADTRVKKEERSNKTNIFRWDDECRVQYRDEKEKNCWEGEPKGNRRTASHVGKKHMLCICFGGPT